VKEEMLGELIGEFKGKNTGYRVLPDGKIESTAQGTGKILGIDISSCPPTLEPWVQTASFWEK
jgi:hypothetical protein